MNKELMISIEMDDNYNECVICLDEYHNNQICRLSETYLHKDCDCKYYLHKECMKDWINMHETNTCLMCKNEIKLKETCFKKYTRLICLKRVQKKFFRFIYTILVLIFAVFVFFTIISFCFDTYSYDNEYNRSAYVNNRKHLNNQGLITLN